MSFIHKHKQVAKRASVAAAPLAAWVKANVTYSAVLEKISPLEQEQASLTKYAYIYMYIYIYIYICYVISID